jgi:hypothetical protein
MQCFARGMYQPFPTLPQGGRAARRRSLLMKRRNTGKKWSNILKPRNLHAIPCVVLEVQLSSLRILAGYYVVLHVLALPSTIHIA